MVSARRLTAFVVALGFAAAGSLLAVSPVVADTGDITYHCTIPSPKTTQDIDISLSTDAPTTMVIGQTAHPTLNLSVTIPSGIIGLAKLFGYTHASAAGTLVVGINGTPTTLNATYPKTKIPASGDFTVNIPIPLPELKPTAAGTFKYTPGDLNAALTVYQGEDDSSPDSLQANCTVKDPASNPVIDTVIVTDGSTTPPDKIASTTTVAAPTATYGKAASATVTVSNTSGKPITGNVTISGAGAAQTKPVGANGKTVFALDKRLYAKPYSLKATYAGNAELGASTKTIAFTVAKGPVAAVGFVLNKKPTSKKAGAGTVVIKVPASLRTATGTVKIVLKKGGSTRTITAVLVAGKKKVSLGKLAKGTWAVSVSYYGDSNYKSGFKSTAFTVTR